jgi:hypothetical protein
MVLQVFAKNEILRECCFWANTCLVFVAKGACRCGGVGRGNERYSGNLKKAIVSSHACLCMFCNFAVGNALNLYMLFLCFKRRRYMQH